MRTMALLGLLFCAALAAAPAWADEESEAGTTAVTAAARPEPEGAGKLRDAATFALSVLGFAFFAGLFVIGRTALTVISLAVWPAGTARAAEWVRTRPWLCFGWGVPIGLVSTVAILSGFQVGEGAALLAFLLLAALVLAAAFGSSALCEVAGELLYRLRNPAAEPSRLAAGAAGSAVLSAAVLTPPGWFALLFVLPCFLGAARFLFTEPARLGPVNLHELAGEEE